MKFIGFKKTKQIKIRVITLSDRASQGIYPDKSGEYICEQLNYFFKKNEWNFVIEKKLIPDDKNQLTDLLQNAIDQRTDVIFTTGGTGIGTKDITPDVVIPMLDKEIPGIMEFIRTKYGENLPSALLSRAVAGIIKQTQIYTLPGSVKAVKEYLYEILKILEHAIAMQYDIDLH